MSTVGRYEGRCGRSRVLIPFHFFVHLLTYLLTDLLTYLLACLPAC